MARRCKHCKTEIKPARQCTDIIEKKGYCSTSCLLAHAKAKNAEAQAEKQRKELKQVRENHKTVTKWEAEAQAVINRYVRTRDHGKPCISCGKPFEQVVAEQGWKTGGAWDCGHYKTRAAKPQLRFNTFNMHSQCKSCNAGSGKYGAKAETVGQGYDRGILERLSAERVQWLNDNNEKSKKELMCRNGYIEYLKRIKRIFAKRQRQCAKRKGLDC